MSVPGGDPPARTGRVSLSMANWDGHRGEAKFLGSWEDAVKFLQSPDFTLMTDVRLVTLKQLNPSRRTLPGGPPSSHWKPSPEQSAELEERGRREFVCRACDAAPGEPCADPEPGRTVHGPRYLAAKKAVVAAARAARPRRPKGTA